MSTVDWSKAPEGTTHFRPDTDGYREHWIKPGYFCVTGFEALGWVRRNGPDALKGAVERPVEWDGEGRPPAGTVCEWLMDRTWKRVEIRYVSKHTILAALQGKDDEDPEFALDPDGQEFRPIRTPEQIAAEERAAGITALTRDLNGRLDFNFNIDELEGLYDGGYRALPVQS